MLPALLGQPGFDILKSRDIEKGREQPMPIASISAQEGRELTLRQQRDALKLGQPQPDRIGDDLSGLVDAR